MAYLIAILCVVGIATGQILFKLSAEGMHRAGNVFDKRSLIVLFFALALYGVTTLAWVWVLQKIELGRAYPLMALAFVLVPIGSYFIFAERFNMYYIVGVAVIMLGILLTIKA
ncbi:4-amino-4-deoxy-L-arabinose-phospho-UDP flippase [Pseudomonas chlororaphis]|uniref:EamA family transporter n=1 Tax=Pseudomonas chlororaphis TaxID=587753 RepID=A0AAQ0AN63_9PSED|nr:EamA family transporter [Pseudomonas chlororaphis]AUG42326.1 4-amino-4-deoxy-L-arabinose-phospho-UDP flippase [Pseudomonas chlororaphis]QNR46181.1 EamA family transporter [Pseudomonas chlororaphis]